VSDGRARVLIAGGGTGGHLTPALVVAATIRELAPAVEPVLVGATRGLEARLLPRKEFRFHLLPLEPIYRRQWWRNVRWPFVVPRLLRALDAVFRAERPRAVLGTGGYASAPVVWAALRRGLPAAIQEQNAWPGLANRFLARRVREVYLGAPEAEARLALGARTTAIYTGNPIRPPDPARRDAARRAFGLEAGRRVLLVTGGSQGALPINRAVAAWLDRGPVPDDLDVLWVTGHGTHAEFAPRHRPPRVQVIPYLDPMADAYAVADLVVSRAGMLTVAELCAWGLPAILVPLPTAAADHQAHNARALAADGAAVLLPQAELDADRLAREVTGLLADAARREALAARARARGRPAAAREIATRFLALAGLGNLT